MSRTSKNYGISPAATGTVPLLRTNLISSLASIIFFRIASNHLSNFEHNTRSNNQIAHKSSQAMHFLLFFLVVGQTMCSSVNSQHSKRATQSGFTCNSHNYGLSGRSGFPELIGETRSVGYCGSKDETRGWTLELATSYNGVNYDCANKKPTNLCCRGFHLVSTGKEKSSIVDVQDCIILDGAKSIPDAFFSCASEKQRTVPFCGYAGYHPFWALGRAKNQIVFQGSQYAECTGNYGPHRFCCKTSQRSAKGFTADVSDCTDKGVWWPLHV